MPAATSKRKKTSPASKSKRTSRKATVPRQRFDIQPWLRLLAHPVCRRVYGAAVVVAVFFGLYHASLVSLTSKPRFQLRVDDLMILDPPQWIPPGQLAQIQLPNDAALSIFDPRLVHVLSAAYARNPWVEKVIRVEKVYPNDLRVELRLRKPVAAVRHGGGWYYLVDKNGVRLPGRYESRPDVGYWLPFLQGVAGAPPEPGLVWQAPGVLDGARLAAIWQSKPDLARQINVTCIDVSNVGGRMSRSASEVVLRTESLGTRILWGRVSRPGQTLIADDSKKMEILHNALIRDGYLARDPHLRRVRELDIKSGRLVFRWNR